MQAWFDVLASIAERIHHEKEALVNAAPLETFGRALGIVFLEAALGLLALPLYLFYDTSAARPSFFNRTGCAYSLYRMRKRVTVSVTIPLLAMVGLYLVTASRVDTVTITWDGEAGDGLWSSALNWSTNTVPTTTDDIIFDGTSQVNSTIDPGFQGTVASVQIQSTYTGTIIQARSLRVNGAFTMGNGVFLGSADTIDINGVFTLLGGTFRASSGMTSYATHFRPMAGTYLHNNGTTVFDGTGLASNITFATSPTSVLYLANVTVAKTLTSDGIQNEAFTGAAIVVTGTLDLATGTLRAIVATTSTAAVGTILEAQGPVIHRAGWAGGNGILRITGPARTIEAFPNGYLPRVDINSPGTIFNLNGSGTTTINSLNITAGTVNQNSANLLSSLTLLGGNAVFNGGSGNLLGEEIYVFSGGRAIFGTGNVQVGLNVRTSNTNSVLDLSRVSSFVIRRFSAQSSVRVFGVNTGSTVILPPIPIYIEVVTTSIAGTLDATSTQFIFDNNGSQALLSTVPLTLGALTKIATTSQNLYLPAGVTTTINGPLVLQGANPNALLSIHSSLSSGVPSGFDSVQAIINPIGTRSVQHLAVTQNRNIHPTLIDATGQYVIDNGNVDGWFGMIDITNPTTPGSLTETAETENSVRLLFGTTSTDANFLDYRIFYTTGTTSPTISDQSITSSTQPILSQADYSGQTGVPLTGLTRSRIYTANIWAFDEYGNSASGTTPITFSTLPNQVTNVFASNIEQRRLTINWGTNGNEPTTVYSITDANNTGRTSGLINSTSYDLENLQPSVPYTFIITAHDENNRTNSISVGPFTTASAGGGIITTPTPPPIGPGGGGSSGGGDVLNPTPPPPPPPAEAEDPTQPNFSGRAMIINNDFPETLSRNVTLMMNVPTAELVAISNYPDFIDAVYEPYAETFSWIVTDGFGEKTVYARFLGANGGTLDASDSISYVDFVLPDPEPTPPPATPNPPSTNPPNPPPTRPTPPPTNPPPSGGGNSGGGSTNPRPTTPPAQPTPTTPPPVQPPTPTPTTPTPSTTTSTIPNTTTTPPEEGTTIPDFPIESEVPTPTTPPAQPTPQPTQTIVSPVETVIETITTFQSQPEVVQAARITAPVATTISAVAVTTSLWSVLAPLVRFLFLQPLMFLGLRRREIWGEVYETEHKLPVDLAIVRLSDAVTGKVIQTRVTDMHGRYLFTPKAGTYRLDIVKDGFSFPSHLLKHASADGRHTDLYYGGPIVTSTDGEPIAKNIALDREGSHATHHLRSLTQPVRALQQGMAMAGAVATGISFAATPNLKTFGYILLHVGLGFLFFRYAKPKTPKRTGVIVDAQTKQPLPHAVVRLYNESLKKLVDTKITNNKGEYVFLVGGGSYRIIVEKPGYRSSSTPIVLPESTEAGAITKNISLMNGEMHTSNAMTTPHLENDAQTPDSLPRINLMG